MPPHWDSPEVKEERHRWSDKEESLDCVNLRPVTDEERFKLASDMTDGDPKKRELLEQVQRLGGPTLGLQGGQARKNHGQGKECLVVLVAEFNRVCKQNAGAGTLRARDGAKTQTVAEYCG